MAPRKRSASEQEPPKAAPEPGRVTRSSTRQNANPVNSVKPELPKNKKAKVTVTKKKEKVEEKKEEEALEVADGDLGKRTIIIEHCKQCNSFKTRALQVEKGLLEGVPNISVKLNPDKPRRGCFEIREKDGEIFISLLEMKRPFKPMKDLDMEEVIADIIKKLTG